MYDYTAEVVALFAIALTLATVWVYERHLKNLRYQLNEAIADADLATELYIAELSASQHRHPTNVRVMRVLDGGAS